MMSFDVSYLTDSHLEFLTTLEAKALFTLQRQLAEFTKTLADADKLLTQAIEHKYCAQVAELRNDLSQEAGTVSFDDNGIAVTSTVTETIQWDQAILKRLAENIRAGGERPDTFMSVNYGIDEERYSAWPTILREQFSPAKQATTVAHTFSLQAIQEVGV